MDTKDIGKIVIGLAILALLVTSFTAFSVLFLSSFDQNIQTLNQTNAVETETFNGTEYGVHSLTYTQIGINSFQKSTAAAKYNDTLAAGNGSTAAKVKILTLTEPLDTGAVSAAVWTLRVTAQNATGINVSGNGVVLGKAITGVQNFTVALAQRSTPYTVTLTFIGADLGNVTNVTLDYYNFVTNTNYTATSTAINTTVAGTFRVVYNHMTAAGMDTTYATDAVATGITTLRAIPGWLPMIILAFILLIVLVLLALVIYMARGQFGGLQ
jgi:hypothetical protein